MPDPFDAYQYLTHLRARWRLPAAVVAVAVATSLLISLLLPNKYTARVTLVIEPPAGSDPRASTAVSPVYLESLKTYEHFASSDHLFARVLERFDLRGGWPARSIEGLKRDILRIEIPRSTKILEIAVTLGDPRKAHAAALFLGEETVKLNRKTNRAADEELIEEARKGVATATRRLQEADAARSRSHRQGSTADALKAQLDELRAMREEVDRLALSADLTLAERGGATNRSDRLRREAAGLDRRIAAAQSALAARKAEDDRLDADYESAWTSREQLEKQMRDLQGAIGYRGERLSLLDPGVVPERPSFPNLPLNLLVAAALGLIASLFYLTVEFGLESQKADTLRRTLRVASKT